MSVSIYHLKRNDTHSFNSYTLCNSRSSCNWTKYIKRNFVKGMKFNLSNGQEIPIPGRKCRRCELLLERP